VEIGPGMGVMTKYLLEQKNINLKVVELDFESVAYLHDNYLDLHGNIIEADFLKLDLKTLFGDEPFAVIGNYPYNISSQILFKALEYRNQIPVLSGMFQKEVAERIASPHGNKSYGILSVLLQAYYNIEYLFTVDEHVFNPPPKVKSGVIRLVRNNMKHLPCDEKLFKRVVKAAFNQRRKTLSNSLKTILLNLKPQEPVFRLRPEQLSVQDFIELTQLIERLLNEEKKQD
jgi:16S rRNA (adenine1518-N6/adenine1519-N6)-dimethyltransferase